MALYDLVRGLPLRVERFASDRREVAVSSEFTRVTTIVVLDGDGATGRGEDVTYDAKQHEDFPSLRERGATTLDAYSRALGARPGM